MPAQKAVKFSDRQRLDENLENFRAAWPWLRENLADLLQSGWTRAALFQRGKSRYPAGKWGTAWVDAWRKPNLVVRIGRAGCIEYTFLAGDRQVRQTSTPPAGREKPQ
jgi:hypothetical protein